MKMYDGVLAKTRDWEYKRGIKYLDSESIAYKALSVFYVIFMVYATFMNLLVILGFALTGRDTDIIITVGVCSLIIIAGFILNRFKLFIAGAVTSVAPMVLLNVVFARLMEADFGTGFLGLKWSFYIRHLAPMAIMTLLLVAMTAIAVNAKCKLQKHYKGVVETLFERFRAENPEKSNVSEEEWEKYLENYKFQKNEK